MKRNFLLFLFLFAGLTESFSQAQIFNSAETLDKKTTQIGFNPYFQIYNGENTKNHQYMGANFYFGYGFARHWDVNVKLGLQNHTYDNMPDKVAPNKVYFGVDVEKRLFKTGKRADPGLLMSVSIGTHAWDDFMGGDITLNTTYMFSRQFYAYFAIDTDINREEKDNFPDPPTRHIATFVWIPIGFEYYTKQRGMSIMLEAGIPVVSVNSVISYKQPYTIGGGINFYFKGKNY